MCYGVVWHCIATARVRPHFFVPPDAPLSDFIAAGSSHPVFRSSLLALLSRNWLILDPLDSKVYWANQQNPKVWANGFIACGACGKPLLNQRL